MESDDKFTFLLHFYENRLATFVDWPFEDSSNCAASKVKKISLKTNWIKTT